MQIATDKKVVNFRLSPNTLRRMDELALHEHRKRSDVLYETGGAIPTRTDILRVLVNRAYDAMKEEAPPTLADSLSKDTPKQTTKGKKKCPKHKPNSTPIAPTAPKSERKQKRSKRPLKTLPSSADTSLA